MNKKILQIFAAAVLLLGLFFIIQKEKSPNASEVALLQELKRNCQISETSPYRNEKFGFTFSLKSDELVCDYKPSNQTPDNLEVYVWKKEAFQTSQGAHFGQDIIAKITVNPIPGLPNNQILKEEDGVVAGIQTKIQTIRPSMCGKSCSTARTATLAHNGTTYTIEDYGPMPGLLESFQF